MDPSKLYQLFTHRKPNREVKHLLLWPDPPDLCCVGIGDYISYRSDKIMEDNPTGEVVDYIHHHNRRPPVFVLGERIPGYPPAPPEIVPPAPPGARFAFLGEDYSHCLDIAFFNHQGDPKILDFLKMPFCPWIAAHPNRKALIIYYHGTIPIIVTGKGLIVTERGIEG